MNKFDNNWPLVSFIVFSYNQEKYIEEAILSALSQTYESLEIILTDDCSTDSTFEIMNRMNEEYKGNHRLIINQNRQNLGIGAHINRAMELTKGEFIVVNAGDDISIPERTTEMVNVWLKSGRKAKSVFSNWYKMDILGNIYESQNIPDLSSLSSPRQYLEKHGFVHGATHGWDRDIFELFGPLNENVTHEDTVLPYRSLLLGKISYIQTKLIKYRDGGISSLYLSSDVHEILYGETLIGNSRCTYDLQQIIDDIKTMESMDKFRFNYQVLTKIAIGKKAYHQLIVDLGKRNGNEFKLLLNALGKGAPIKRSIIGYLKYKFSFLFGVYLKIKYL